MRGLIIEVRAREPRTEESQYLCITQAHATRHNRYRRSARAFPFMEARTPFERFLAASLSVLLVSCSGAIRHTAPANTEELSHLVLIIKELNDGRVTHTWQRAEDIDLSQYRHWASTSSATGRIVLASGRRRDCDKELLDCHRECMKRPVPPDYNQYEYNRGLGGRADYCNQQCLPPYLECKEQERARPVEFTAMDNAVDWLKRNREAVMVGSAIVIAGVVFVVVSAGAGVVVLAPVLLVASTATPSEPNIVAVSP